MTDRRVEAVRNDPTVGGGSCSNIDECYTDADLVRYLDEIEAKTPAQAVKACKRSWTIFRSVHGWD